MGRIKIEITEMIVEEYAATEQVCVKEIATDKTQLNYSNRQEPVFDREFVTKDVTKQRERKVNLLTQEIDEADMLDLPAVIAAINNLELASKRK